MKKLTKKLFIIAMIAAGAVLSKPAFAMEASNSSRTNQYSNVDLTEYETYRNYLEKINQLETNSSETYYTLYWCGCYIQSKKELKSKEELNTKWSNLIDRNGELNCHIPELKTALKNAHNCQNVNNSEYREYKKKFFDLYDSLTKEYDPIYLETGTLLTAIAPFQPNIPEDIQILYPNINFIK